MGKENNEIKKAYNPLQTARFLSTHRPTNSETRYQNP